MSLIAVAVSTGCNPFLMALVAAGTSAPGPSAVLTAVGVSLLLISMYPVSQIFQLEEDRRRNDTTFAVAYGLKGVRFLFAGCYLVGLGVVWWTLSQVDRTLGGLFGIFGALGGFVTAWHLWHLEGKEAEYDRVMQLKYFTSLVFVGFIVLVLVLREMGPWDQETKKSIVHDI